MKDIARMLKEGARPECGKCPISEFCEYSGPLASKRFCKLLLSIVFVEMRLLPKARGEKSEG